jgi:hypothetical protein
MILIYGWAAGEVCTNWYMKCNDKHRPGKKLSMLVVVHWHLNVFG